MSKEFIADLTENNIDVLTVQDVETVIPNRVIYRLRTDSCASVHVNGNEIIISCESTRNKKIKMIPIIGETSTK